LNRLMLQIPPLQGHTFDYPDFRFFVLNAPFSLQGTLPQYLYIWCSTLDQQTLLGTMKEAIVTVSIKRMSCSACHSGRRHEHPTPAAERRTCPHIGSLLLLVEDEAIDSEEVRSEPHSKNILTKQAKFSSVFQQREIRVSVSKPQ